MSKSYKSSLFKRIIDLGVVREAEVNDLVRIWRVGTGDEKAITLENFVQTVNTDLGSGGLTLTEVIAAIEEAIAELPPAVTIGTPTNGLSIIGQEISLGLSSSSTTGALSDTDWNTFNGKIGGTIASDQVAFGTGVGTIGGNDNLKFESNAFLRLRGGGASGDGVMLRGSSVGFRFYNDTFTEFFRISSTASIISLTSSLTFTTVSNGNIRLIPSGTGKVLIGADAAPTETLDVNGTTRIRSISNASGNFLTTSATGVIQQRTSSETLSDIGAQATIAGALTEGYVATVVGGVPTWAVASGGLVGAGAGLSIDGSGDIQLGNGADISYTENALLNVVFSIPASSIYAATYQSVNSVGTSKAYIGGEIYNESGKGGSILEQFENTNDGGFKLNVVNGAFDSFEIGLVNNYSGTTFSAYVKDDINSIGLGDFADYSANKTDFSYATKKMLDDATATSGTFTPTLIDNAGGASYTYSLQSGSYFKIGKLVHCYIFIQISGTTGTATGQLQISGLPFTASGINHYGGQLTVFTGSGLSDSDLSLIQPFANSGVLRFIDRSDNNYLNAMSITSSTIIASIIYEEFT